ncbi:hypothetical protein [Trujillonella endophytica]|uniref:Uncharacterized protein n=1 Tax=Trujillonella endophytica TaxID=673521 RepID=A0A1H8URX5_9ACTN|nr:hypothetical protein [Trujillella endophytica]SEP05960.1 hypothetical protein SAMN05660991_03050 [Trujillella endophytica]
MTAVLPRPTSAGRHRAPETSDEPRWASAAEFSAAWARAGRHAAPEASGRHASDDFDWVGRAAAAG